MSDELYVIVMKTIMMALVLGVAHKLGYVPFAAAALFFMWRAYKDAEKRIKAREREEKRNSRKAG